MLSTRNLHLPAFSSRKLAPRWIGPFQIIAQRGTAYTLELPHELRGLHPSFHAGLLKPFVGEPPARPPPVHVQAQEEYEVAAIIGHRHKKGQIQYLVCWKGYGAESDTWQQASDLKNAPKIVQSYILSFPDAV